MVTVPGTPAELAKPFEGGDKFTYADGVSGAPFVGVICTVQRNGQDLAIKGARPPGGMAGRLFTSTDLRVLRKCPRPVWIGRLVAIERCQRVPAAVDPASSDPRMQKLIPESATLRAAREHA